MGHNFGMYHDFDKIHGGQNSACNGKGIMSYNDNKPMQWSSCSVSDFTGFYKSKNWGNTCLKGDNYLKTFLNLGLKYHICITKKYVDR